MLAPLGDEPVIVHALRVFQDHPRVTAIHVIAAPGDLAALERLFADPRRRRKLAPWVRGGSTRQESVASGLAALEADPPDWVLVHDAARPFCSPGLVDRVLAALAAHPAVVPLLPLHDTIREVLPAASRVVDRSRLYRCQTPQGFHWSVLCEAHRVAAGSGPLGTDDAQLVERMGGILHFMEGDPRNIKLTTPMDFRLGEWLLAHPDWGC